MSWRRLDDPPDWSGEVHLATQKDMAVGYFDRNTDGSYSWSSRFFSRLEPEHWDEFRWHAYPSRPTPGDWEGLK